MSVDQGEDDLPENSEEPLGGETFANFGYGSEDDPLDEYYSADSDDDKDSSGFDPADEIEMVDVEHQKPLSELSSQLSESFPHLKGLVWWTGMWLGQSLGKHFLHRLGPTI